MNRAEGNWSRPLALAIALALPGSALAVGLGEARVDSYLNQPLDVRMRLLDASADDLDTLTVTAASPSEFERLGVMSSALALGLEISVDRSESPPVIRVRSSRPAADPVVQLLIDARWSGGRMLREYTLFLDPPTLPVAPPPPVRQEPEPARPVPAPMTRQSPEAIRPALPRSQPRARAISGQSYGPVGNGETLWSIARAALPADDISMNQMMMAIVELNPGAFRDRNINQLLRGARLELPTAEQARALNAAVAAAAVAEQNRAFRTGTSRAAPVISDAARMPEPAAPAPDAPRAPGVTGTAPEDHRLELVPPTDEAGGSGLAGDDAAEVESLRQQLARAEEELFATRQEAQEFQSRLTELETLVRERADEGLALRDAELAGLEQTLRDARMATAEGADPALRADVSERLDQYLADLGQPEADAARADADVADALEGFDEDAAVGPDDASTGAAAQQTADAAASEAPAPVRTQVGSDRSLLDRILGAPIWLLGGIAALILAVLAFLGLRAKRNRAEADSADLAARPKPRASAASSRAVERDPLQRARDGVRDQPASLAAHLALLQALSASADEQEFGDALEDMFERVETGAEPEWRQALDLAERIVPGHALVKGSADWVAGSGSSASAPSDELDQEAEVDDLMSRLDADMEESDDGDWDEQAEEIAPDRDAAVGPLLRSDRDEQPEIGRGSSLADDDTVDFSDWLDEDEPDADATAKQPTQPDEADLVLDWPNAGGSSGEPEVADTEQAASEAGRKAKPEAAATEQSESTELAGHEDVQHEADDDDLFTQGDDDVEVKLDLARAYVSWNSTDSARTLLEEILREGNDAQRAEARQLLEGLGEGEG